MSELQVLSPYDAENKQLALSILDVNYYSNWKNGDGNLELFVTLDNGGKKIFKEYFNKKEKIYSSTISDPDKILSNIDSLLDWYINNKFKCDITLFGDGWVDTSLFNDVINLVQNKFKDKLILPKNIYIPIPVHCFAISGFNNYLANIYNVFEETLHIKLIFQINALGGVIDALPSEVYRQMFLFLASNWDAVIKTTLYQDDMQLWIENAHWWATVPNAIFSAVSFELETSNRWEDVDEDIIQQVLSILSVKLLSFTPKDEILNAFVDLKKPEKTILRLGYNGCIKGLDRVLYGFSNSFCIRCGDLAIPMSHGLAYRELLIGEFVLRDGIIVDYNNFCAERLIPKIYSKVSCQSYCDQCPYRGICSGFDPAVSFDVYFDVSIAVRRHCNIQKTILKFMIMNLKKLGILDAVDDWKLCEAEKLYFKDLIEYVEKIDEAERL